jgi:sugar phosphate isomerase/epimerase
LRRRDFLLAGAAGIAGLGPSLVFAQRTKPLGSIGLQLYTVRDLAKKDLERTLAAVAGVGYREVEFAGHHGHSPARISRMLGDTGLSAPSGHYGASEIESRIQSILEDSFALGHKYVTISWIDAQDRTPAGYRRVASVLNNAAVLARAAGIQLAYHNHTFEFSRLASGERGYEIILAECPQENLALQADVFWMKKAGEDPIAWFKRHPNRYHMLHVKDMGPGPAYDMRDVGSGEMKWPQIFTAARDGGVKHFFVEHDEPEDAMASITRSYGYLRTLK